MKWNIVVTAQPGRERQRELLQALDDFGEFCATEFRDVCVGRVGDVDAFLERVQSAEDEGEAWIKDLGRIIPVEEVFEFTPTDLEQKLKQAVSRFARRMYAGSFHVRLERRGMAGTIATQDLERAVADHLFQALHGEGKAMRVDFNDPDYVVVAETVGNQCGVALISRATRSHWRWVHPR